MRLTRKRADNGRYYLSGLAKVSDIYLKEYGQIQAGYAVEKLAEYEDLEEQGMLLRVPQIKKNKTLYWIWGEEIMPVLFRRITGCGVDDSGKPHVAFEVETKKDRIFTHTYRRKPVEHTFKAGDKRYFYSEDLGKTIFLTREEAEAALKELEGKKRNS